MSSACHIRVITYCHNGACAVCVFSVLIPTSSHKRRFHRERDSAQSIKKRHAKISKLISCRKLFRYYLNLNVESLNSVYCDTVAVGTLSLCYMCARRYTPPRYQRL